MRQTNRRVVKKIGKRMRRIEQRDNECCERIRVKENTFFRIGFVREDRLDSC